VTLICGTLEEHLLTYLLNYSLVGVFVPEPRDKVSVHEQLTVCPVCLSLTFVHCGQTVGRIKMKLGTQVGLGPGHIVL